MALFRRNKDASQEETAPQRNMNNVMLFRLLGIGYVLYMAYDVVKAYFVGGEDAPSLTLVLLAVIVLGGGSVAVGILSWKDYKKYRAQEAEKAQAELSQDEEQPE